MTAEELFKWTDAWDMRPFLEHTLTLEADQRIPPDPARPDLKVLPGQKSQED
jgi:hypothetical protein